jgi:hypothetical protein
LKSPPSPEGFLFLHYPDLEKEALSKDCLEKPPCTATSASPSFIKTGDSLFSPVFSLPLPSKSLFLGIHPISENIIQQL